LAKQRLDTLLVNLDLCTSRQQAQALIRTGKVTVNQQLVDKPGTEVDMAANIQIKERSRYVSRGGEKLAKALEVFCHSPLQREFVSMVAFPQAVLPTVCCKLAQRKSMG
jgi:Predicted rRNA methylase